MLGGGAQGIGFCVVWLPLASAVVPDFLPLASAVASYRWLRPRFLTAGFGRGFIVASAMVPLASAAVSSWLRPWYRWLRPRFHRGFGHGTAGFGRGFIVASAMVPLASAAVSYRWLRPRFHCGFGHGTAGFGRGFIVASAMVPLASAAVCNLRVPC